MKTNVKADERTRSSTSKKSQRKVDEEILRNLKSYRNNNQDIDVRIKELDREWDVERTLQLNAATLSLTGTLLGIFVDKRWLALPAVVGLFLGQHAIQGWCPPLPALRKLGFRTRPEIDREKYALKALRGDFEDTATASKAWRAVNK
jgi:hypothetical protein